MTNMLKRWWLLDYLANLGQARQQIKKPRPEKEETRQVLDGFRQVAGELEQCIRDNGFTVKT
ncbi:MAG: hypothetical protein ACYCX4_11095 [Bacillota bacterium]